ncbi:MAG: magnetochrome domain-containing protein [Alphaproteobacteria bacterium]|nr:magnetochrome domain-containing protein [Alphaproteobacteria bacterium]
MEPFVEENLPETPAVCSKSLKKYFYVAGAVAILILLGAYWYTGYYTQGFGFIGSFNAFGAQSAAVNMAPRPLPGGAAQARQPAFPSAAIGVPSPWTGVANPAPAVGLGVQGAGSAPPSAGGSNFSAVVMNLHHSVVNVTVSRGNGGGGGGGVTTAPVSPVVQTPGVQDPNAPGGEIRFAAPLVGGVLENVGSGVIVRADGYVLTNFHVVRGAASAFVTVFDDGGTQRYNADIIKMDESLDLALLKIKPRRPLIPAVLGDSDRILVAEEVITIGSPFGLDQTVSRGIVSGMRKSLMIEGVTHANLIQTDAAINQGNSGGPLVNIEGQVIGINTAIYTPTGAFSGVGFAIPSNHARKFVETEIVLPDSAVMAKVAAFPTQGGGNAPPIYAGMTPPHLDGREKLACSTCHQILQRTAAGPMAPVAMGQFAAAPAMGQFAAAPAAMGQLAAMPGGAAPPIQAGAAAPHTDGREAMDCTSCHQIIGGAAVAFQYQFAKPPSSLAVNVATPTAPPATGSPTGPLMGAGAVASPMPGLGLGQVPAAGNGNPADVGTAVTIGAVVHTLTPTLAQRVGQAAGEGVFVASVVPGSSAAAAKIIPGDVIVKVDGRRVATPEQVSGALKTIALGDVVRIAVMRDGKRQNIKLVMGATDMGTAPPPSNKPPPTEFAWLGVEIENFAMVALSTDPQGAGIMGAVVNEVVPASRAAKAGIKMGDVIIQINNQPVETAEEFDRAIRTVSKRPNNLVKVSRNGAEIFVVI